jgi:ADP-heptose:LPS heptosyltransferase
MRVVALVPGSIADQILFFPTLDSLQRSYPDAWIDVIVEPRSKVAYQVNKSVHEVFSFDYKDRNSLADWSNLLGTIRDREYDVAITARESWFVGLFLWLSGIPTRIGFEGSGANFLTHVISPNTSQYIPHIYHDLLRPLGINTSCPPLAINLVKPDVEWAKQQQKRLGIGETGYILIYGGYGELSSNPDNIYRIDGYFVPSLVESFPDIKVIPVPDIGKLAAIIGSASLMVTVNGSPLQLAIAIQTYTIALLSSADSNQLMPVNDKFLAIKSSTGKTADIPPATVLKTIWG